MKSGIPEKIVCADDCDFITEMEKTEDKVYEKTKEIMTGKNLLVNEEKSEYSYHREKRIKRRGKRMKKCDKTRIKA